MSYYIPPPEKCAACDAAFGQNSFITCYYKYRRRNGTNRKSDAPCVAARSTTTSRMRSVAHVAAADRNCTYIGLTGARPRRQFSYVPNSHAAHFNSASSAVNHKCEYPRPPLYRRFSRDLVYVRCEVMLANITYDAFVRCFRHSMVVKPTPSSPLSVFEVNISCN